MGAQRIGAAAVVTRGYQNRNPTAFLGDVLDEPYKTQSDTRVFKHYGILFGKSNSRFYARIYYYNTTYHGVQTPQDIAPRVLCEASTDEPHFLETLYSTHNRSACYHMGRLIAKRADECGVLQHATLLKYSLGRPLGVHNIKQIVRTHSIQGSSRMRAFAEGYSEERGLRLNRAMTLGVPLKLDGDGNKDDDFMYWPMKDGKPLGKESENKEDTGLEAQ